MLLLLLLLPLLLLLMLLMWRRCFAYAGNVHTPTGFSQGRCGSRVDSELWRNFVVVVVVAIAADFALSCGQSQRSGDSRVCAT